MKIYLAARFSRQLELRGYADQIRTLGHGVTSRWLGQDDESTYEELTPEGCRKCGEHDVEDVERAHILISFTEPVGIPNTSRGGRHVELGIAIGQRKLIYAVGPKENVFHWLQVIQWFETFEECLAHIMGRFPTDEWVMRNRK